jgi:hypothetical protein
MQLPASVRQVIDDTYWDNTSPIPIDVAAGKLLRQYIPDVSNFIQTQRQRYSLGSVEYHRMRGTAPQLLVDYINNSGEEIITVTLQPTTSSGTKKTGAFVALDDGGPLQLFDGSAYFDDSVSGGMRIYSSPNGKDWTQYNRVIGFTLEQDRTFLGATALTFWKQNVLSFGWNTFPGAVLAFGNKTWVIFGSGYAHSCGWWQNPVDTAPPDATGAYEFTSGLYKWTDAAFWTSKDGKTWTRGYLIVNGQINDLFYASPKAINSDTSAGTGLFYASYQVWSEGVPQPVAVWVETGGESQLEINGVVVPTDSIAGGDYPGGTPPALGSMQYIKSKDGVTWASSDVTEFTLQQSGLINTTDTATTVDISSFKSYCGLNGTVISTTGMSFSNPGQIAVLKISSSHPTAIFRSGSPQSSDGWQFIDLPQPPTIPGFATSITWGVNVVSSLSGTVNILVAFGEVDWQTTGDHTNVTMPAIWWSEDGLSWTAWQAPVPPGGWSDGFPVNFQSFFNRITQGTSGTWEQLDKVVYQLL